MVMMIVGAAQLEFEMDWMDRWDGQTAKKPRKRSGFREGETERVSGQRKERSGTQEGEQANRRWAGATPQQLGR